MKDAGAGRGRTMAKQSCMDKGAHLHEGHRQRMVERFLKEGPVGFAEHEILEIFLYNILPRTNTNELAHRLIDTFGSFAGVCDAPKASLMQVEGVGERTANYIKILPGVVRTYCISQVDSMRIITGSEDAGKLLMPYYVGSTIEEFRMISLDSSGRVLGVTLIGEGDLEHAQVDLRKIIETAIMYRATKVILAHNHPRSVALASEEDLLVTARIIRALELINVAVLDHLVFSYALDQDHMLGEFTSIMKDMKEYL